MNRPLSIIFVLALALSACATPTTVAPTLAPTKAPEPTPAPVSPIPSGPVRIVGTFTYSNPIITEYYAEMFVALIDVTGFVKRDREWEVPVKSQVLGYLKLNTKDQKAEYQLSLPARPEGTFNDVDNNGKQDKGLQVFAIDWGANITGGPFYEGDDKYRGWPTYLASIKIDSENKKEVIGGKFIIWAPDDKQQFPTGYGNDGLLFTADDPVGPVPAGYSVIDLDKKPFGIIRDAEPSLELYEPKDAEIKDYSKLSYTEAFEALHKKVSVEWAFNGVKGKEVNWQALYDRISPKIADAQKNKDGKAFYLAIAEYIKSIPDGHVGFTRANDNYTTDFREQTDNGYGFAIRELDSGKVIVTYVKKDAPIDKEGLKVGAEILEFNGLPIKDAISKVVPFSGPFSLEYSKRYQQARYLTRARANAEATVKYTNPDGQTRTVKLTAIKETDSFNFTSINRGRDPNALQVESRILDSGVGYIKINSNAEDLNLIIRLFERALQVFSNNKVPGIVIDMRQNGGGAPLGLAGFFYDKEITLSQLQYFSDKTGKFENEGPREKILPNVNQYKFDKIVVMVSTACASACEIESFGFSQVPGAIVVGATPSAGVEAEVGRGQYLLPDGLGIQVSTGRFINPDGTIFLEGVGVQPTVKVTIDEKFALSTEDLVLKTAEAAALGRTTTSSGTATGGATLAAVADSKKALGSIKFLEDVAKEKYADKDLSQAGKTYTYSISTTKDQSLMWMSGWCATTQAILDDNYKNITLTFTLNGKPVDVSQMAVLEGKQTTQYCKLYYAAVSNFPKGDTKLETKVTFAKAINDGTSDYPAGTHTYVYTVTAP